MPRRVAGYFKICGFIFFINIIFFLWFTSGIADKQKASLWEGKEEASLETLFPLTNWPNLSTSCSLAWHAHNANVASLRFQTLVDQTDVGVYTAYIDQRHGDGIAESRSRNGTQNGVLRLFLAKQSKREVQLFCHFLMPTGTVDSVASRNLAGSKFKFYEFAENHNRQFGGFTAHCDLTTTPEDICGFAVSTRSSFNPVVSSFLPVIQVNANTTRFLHRFGVCVPALHHTDQINLSRFRDWMRIHTKLGVTIFRIYFVESIPPAIKQTVHDFQLTGNTIQLVPLLWPGNRDRVFKGSWYYFQTIAVNDCLFRSMPDTEFVFFGDIDEILVPRQPTGWDAIVSHRDWNDAKFPGMCFPTYIFPTAPEQVGAKNFTRFHASFVKRQIPADWIRRKCLVRPLKVFEMGIHHISKPFEEASVLLMKTVNVESLAHVHHYRNNRSPSIVSCINDTSILAFL